MKTAHLHLRSFAVVFTTLLLLVAIPATAVFAAASGPNYPLTAGTSSWTNPGNILSDNDVYSNGNMLAGAGNVSSYLRASNFGFTIPDGASLEGIVVEIGRYGQGDEPRVIDNTVRLVNGSGVIVGENKADTVTGWPATEATASYGAVNNLWGASLTVADINNANFGVVLSITNPFTGTRTGYVDFIRVSVTYNGGTTVTKYGTGSVSQWASPTSILGDDGAYSNAIVLASANTNYLRASNFGFNIPGDATVDGITVEMNRYSNGAAPRILDSTIQLINGSSVIVGDNKADLATNWPGPSAAEEGIATYGGPADTWAAGLSAADINSTNFGVVIAVSNPNADSTRTAYIDYIRITVTYTESGSATPTTTTLSSLSSVVYGTPVTFTATVSPTPTNGVNVEFYDGLTLLGTGTTSSGIATYTTGATDLNVAGSPHSITAKFVGNGSFATSTSVAQNQVVTKATPTLSVTNSPVTYDGAGKSATVTGSVAGTASNILTGGAATQTNAGTYAVTANFTPTDTANYNTLTGASAGNFVISPKPITVTPDTGQSKVYGTADPVFTYTHTPLVGTDALTGALGRDPGNDVGTYAFTQGTLSASANYTIIVAAETFEITKATPTLSVTNSPVIYDGAAHAATVTGSVPGVVSNILTGGAATQTDKGVYPVTADFVPTDTLNYNSLTDAAAGNFVITGKIITVTPDAGQNKVYGDDDPVFTYTNDELEPGDVFTGALGREAGEDIGNYDFTIGTLSAGDNYAIVLADETFEITVKPITVTPNPGQRKAPGDPDPVFTYTSDPLVADDAFTGALGREAGEDIGTYAFTLGTLSAGSSYDLSLAPETFEITDKPDPTLSVTNSPVTYTGLGQSAVVTGSVPGTVSNILTGGAATKINAGTYPVTADFVPTDTSSYNSLIGASAGDFVINQAALTVTANNQTIVAGSPDPVFTVTYSGFVNGETAAVLTTAPTCSVAAPHTTPGAYDITCSGGVATNYAFTYVKGTLTVTPSNSAPTNIALSKTTVDQKQAVGTLVGSFSTTDPNPADTFTYSLVAGTGSADNASFTISGNELRTAAVFDFSVKNSYAIRVRSTDNGGLFFEKAFTITVNSQAPVFTDVPFDYWANNYIERLYKAGVTGGCGVGIYCPDDSVTRAQMAVFLLKGIKGSGYVPPAVGDSTGFTDVATDYWAAPWIKQLAAEGITAGCGDGTTYCPEQAVTRAQMAVFLLKSKYGKNYAPPGLNGDTTFTDVAIDYWAAAWIKQLAAENITGGCGAGIYCPEQVVTRAQMAVFLVKTFNLP